jgi:hypothetical protein
MVERESERVTFTAEDAFFQACPDFAAERMVELILALEALIATDDCAPRLYELPLSTFLKLLGPAVLRKQLAESA